MTAREAAELTAVSESVDNSKDIIAWIAAAAKQRKHSIEVPRTVMTGATLHKLRELGYQIFSKHLDSPTMDDWTRCETVYTVMW